MDWILPDSPAALNWIQLICGVLAALLVIYVGLASYKARTLSEKTVGELVGKAEQAEQRAAGAEATAAELRERAQKAEQRTAELERKLKPRMLTAAQKAALVRVLNTQKQRGHEVVIRSLPGDDAQAFAEEFVAVFAEAGWRPSHHPTLAMPGAKGLIDTSRDSPPGMDLLIAAMREAGIPFQTLRNDLFPGGELTLVVAPKP